MSRVESVSLFVTLWFMAAALSLRVCALWSTMKKRCLISVQPAARPLYGKHKTRAHMRDVIRRSQSPIENMIGKVSVDDEDLEIVVVVAFWCGH